MTGTPSQIELAEPIKMRTEVMAIDRAGDFIRTWRELNDQVRQVISQDVRYRAIKANRTTDHTTGTA